MKKKHPGKIFGAKNPNASVILYFMKITVIGFFINMIFLTVSPAAGRAQNLEHVPYAAQPGQKTLAMLFEDIESQTGYSFLMMDQHANALLNKPVALDKVGNNLAAVLSQLEQRTLLEFTAKDKKIIVKRKEEPEAKPQQPGRISGKIMDNRGETLAGATVKVVELNRSAQSAVDGSYSFQLAAGAYTIEVSYLGYQTKRVTGVNIRAGEMTPLAISLSVSTAELGTVTVTAGYKKASVEGLYAAQKNAASVTDGISAEQIARTPDNDMGQVLKRISGLTTINNRNVVVRGMSDRYNQAMLDGVAIPSTSMNKRDFSFDIIPTEMVSSVVVNKTATPDVSSEFSGGQVSINTLDIPDRNFTSIQVGSGFNSQSIGSDIYQLGQRHASEYFGFFDKSAKQPEGILSWSFQNEDVPPPGIPGSNTDDMELYPGAGIPYSSLDAVGQSKRLSAEPLKLHKTSGRPNQNYRFSLGRVYNFADGMRFGFSASASLRNDQQLYEFNNLRGTPFGGAQYADSTKYGYNGAGKSFRFNSNSGLVANLGLQGSGFKVVLKNMYARTYSNNYNEAVRLNYPDLGHNPKPYKEQYQLPEAMALQQHQLSGEYQLPWDIKATGMVAFNKITQRILDERKFKYQLTMQLGDQYYFQTPNIANHGQAGTDALSEDSRMWTHVDEMDYNWAAGFSKTFGTGKAVSTLVKLGYQGYDKQRDLNILRMIPFSSRGSLIEAPYEEVLDPANMGSGVNQAYYWAQQTNGPVFDGRIQSHSVYVMADQKLWDKLRLVYGVRGESFELNSSQEDMLKRLYGPNPDEFISFRKGVMENGWRWLPSVNATYEVTGTFNVRSSYSRTVIRPDFRESSFFGFYDYELDANISGDRVESTLIDNVDVRLEWYPSPGEIVSLTGYHKYLDRPIELIMNPAFQSGQYTMTNMESATNLGLEMEFRKHLGFLGDQPWWEDIFVYGNGSLLKSKVKVMSPWMAEVIDDQGNSEFRQQRLGEQDRPLLGQSPWLLNLGMGYWGDQFGATASYNQRGYRTNLTAAIENAVEYEKAPGQLDAQLYARFFKKRAELKLNMANLLNKWTFFYRNSELMTGGGEESDWVHHKGDNKFNKEDGDTIMYRRKEGQRISLSLTYNF